MRKITVHFCWIISLFCFVYSAQGNAKMAPPMPTFEVSTADAKKHIDGIVKTRPLNETEKQLQNLLTVAKELKVEKFMSHSKEPGSLSAQNISVAMITKMHENPKWDVALSAQGLKVINSHIDLLKSTFGAESYGWAWFAKQTDKKFEAKLILSYLFDEGFQKIMQMSELHFGGSSPLAEMQFVHQALAPLSKENENVIYDSKMQKMKNHFSNLPPSNIKT